MILPEEYTVQKFLQLSGYPRQKQRGKIIEAGCPMCREGDSWGKKRRLYFIVRDDHIYCHNCGWNGNTIKYVQVVECKTYSEVLQEAREYDVLPRDLELNDTVTKPAVLSSLPDDCINLYDTSQVNYYSDNSIVSEVCKFATNRGLMNAINKPSTLWLSLTDYIHKNRLVLPFYDLDNSIIFYQTRTVLPSEKLPKYLSKVGGGKSLFNINRIDPDLDNIFIFEGPIDACFVRNGVAVAGIQESDRSYTAKQLEQLSSFPLHDKVWVLDSQWQDRAAKIKTKTLIEQGETVFIWPEQYGKRFKDFNDMTIGLGINEIPYKFILDNSHTGLKAHLVLNVT